jgi:hypothetical protein
MPYWSPLIKVVVVIFEGGQLLRMLNFILKIQDVEEL